MAAKATHRKTAAIPAASKEGVHEASCDRMADLVRSMEAAAKAEKGIGILQYIVAAIETSLRAELDQLERQPRCERCPQGDCQFCEYRGCLNLLELLPQDGLAELDRLDSASSA